MWGEDGRGCPHSTKGVLGVPPMKYEVKMVHSPVFYPFCLACSLLNGFTDFSLCVGYMLSFC